MTKAIDKIKDAFKGYELYYVGGYVRDSIMDVESHDIDITTNATPMGMITTCKLYNLNYRYTKNSIAHGTITIEGIEVTTFRKDISSIDGHNTTVKFADTIEEDLSRRDFTCNAMAQNLWTNELVDPFGGVQDIKDKIIKAVGNPYDRLKEDTLRALRAVRFANKLDFSIDDDLQVAIDHIDISNLSVERVRDEFMKILETREDSYLNLILWKVIPEFKALYNLDGGDNHNETVDVHSVLTMRKVMKASYKPLLAFAGLIHDIGKAETYNNPDRQFKGHEDTQMVRQIMERMKFSNDDIDYVCVLVKNHMRWHFFDGKFETPSDRAIRRAIRDIPDNFNKEEILKDLIILTWADCQANLLNEYESLEDYIKRRGIYDRALKFIREQPEIKISNGLELNGNDLITMGFKPSPLFAVILKDVLNRVIGEVEKEEDKLENKKEILMNFVENTYGNMR